MPGDSLTVEPQLPVCSAALPEPKLTSVGSTEVPGAAACLSVHPSEAASTPMPLIGVRKGTDLALDGYKVLGPAVTLQLGQPLGQRGVDVLLPFGFAQIPKEAQSQRHRLVVLSRDQKTRVHGLEFAALSPAGSRHHAAGAEQDAGGCGDVPGGDAE